MIETITLVDVHEIIREMIREETMTADMAKYDVPAGGPFSKRRFAKTKSTKSKSLAGRSGNA